VKTYRRLLGYIHPYLKLIIPGLLFSVLAQGSTAGFPWLIKEFLDKVLQPGKPMHYLYLLVLAILALMASRGIFNFLQSYIMAKAGQKFIIDLRENVYRHLQKLSLAYYEKRKTGVIMSNLTNDVGALQSAIVDNLVQLVGESFSIVACITMVFYFNWRLALITLITAPLIGITVGKLGRKIRGAGKISQESIAEVTSVLQESISAVRVVKSYVREDYEIERFATENDFNFRAQMRSIKLSAIMSPAVEFLGSIGVAFLVWYGGLQVINGTMTTGDLVAFLMYAGYISNPLKRISNALANIQRASAAADRVFEVLDTVPDVENKPNAMVLPHIIGSIELDSVEFEYDKNEPVLRGVSLKIKPGEVVALVGPSGAGKTTIVNIIPRFYDVTAGSVKVDGIDVRDVTMDSLREQIGLVPQENILFHGTIYNNILYGKLDATKEQVEAAAMAANAHNFILEQPFGYQTIVGERGSTLSGGQRQRVAIARAILKDPRILILDEATSALDNESEKLVQEALEKLMVGRTSIVIAHRLTTVQNADLIVVMDQGRIVEQGKHEELLANNQLYSKLYYREFDEVEATVEA